MSGKKMCYTDEKIPLFGCSMQNFLVKYINNCSLLILILELFSEIAKDSKNVEIFAFLFMKMIKGVRGRQRTVVLLSMIGEKEESDDVFVEQDFRLYF